MEIVNGTEITYLYAQGQPFAIHKKNVNETNCINYLHLDYQGSIMAITSQSGTILEERNGVYAERSRSNVWGRPRNPNTLEYVLPNPFGSGSPVKRGYTFHEHLEEFNLINMNGRMYDPLLARFLNADPLLQENTDGQNFNRYSYVLNNPTKYTDPSGYAFQGAGNAPAAYDAMIENQRHNSVMGQEQQYQDFKNEIRKKEEFIFGKSFGGGKENGPIKGNTATWSTDIFNVPMSGVSNKSKKVGATGIDVNNLSIANGLFGTAHGFGEISTLAGQGKYITSKGLIRDINFTKLTQHSIPYASAGKILKSLGRATNFLDISLDAYAYRNNQISGKHFTVNTSVTVWSVGVGWLGMGVPALVGGTMYFGIDNFYPGGVKGAMKLSGNLIEQNQKILGPRFNLYRDH
jgi:RHS repeat-associated protein